MAFPLTPILDSFTRADSASLGANWNEIGGGGQIVSNAMQYDGGISEWKGGKYIDCEVYATLGGSVDQIVYLEWRQALDTDRTQDPTTASGWSGYYAEFDPSANSVRVFKYAPTGGSVQIGSTINPTINRGDSIGVSMAGNTIKIWVKPSGGSWAQAGSDFTDSTYTSRGRIAVEFGGSSVAIDDFGGGTTTWTPGNSNGTGNSNGQFALTDTFVGDLIVVAMTDGATADFSDSPPTDDKGNTYSLNYGISTYNFQSLYVWTAINVGSGTVNIDCADSGVFQAYVGHAVTPPGITGAGTVIIDVARDNIEGAASGTDNISSGTGTCHSADGYAFGIILNDGTSGTIAAGTGWTQRNRQGIALDLMLETKAVTAGSVQALASFNATWAGAAVLIVFATDLTQSTQQISIAADADDASAYRTQTGGYAGIDSATLFQEPDSTHLYVNQEFTTPNYYKEEMYLRFDTSIIPASADIQWARLWLYPTTLTNVDGFLYLLADYYDFGGAPVVSGDWGGSGSNSASIFARHDPGKWAVSSLMPINIRDLSGIKRSGEANAQGATGITGIRVVNGYTGGNPTGKNLWEFAARELYTATDDFNRADGGLGANWTTFTVVSFNIVSNQIENNSGNDNANGYNARSCANDQWSQATIKRIDNGSGINSDTGVGVLLRGAATTYYRIVFNNANSGQIGVSKFVSGAYTNLALISATSVPKVGDVVRAQIAGYTIKVYLNGVLQGTVTDPGSSIASGLPGVTQSTPHNGALDDWSGGDLVSYEPKLEVFWHEVAAPPAGPPFIIPFRQF